MFSPKDTARERPGSPITENGTTRKLQAGIPVCKPRETTSGTAQSSRANTAACLEFSANSSTLGKHHSRQKYARSFTLGQNGPWTRIRLVFCLSILSQPMAVASMNRGLPPAISCSNFGALSTSETVVAYARCLYASAVDESTQFYDLQGIPPYLFVRTAVLSFVVSYYLLFSRLPLCL